jgi:hypothetical protein
MSQLKNLKFNNNQMNQKVFLSALIIALLFLTADGLKMKDEQAHNLQSLVHEEEKLGDQLKVKENSYDIVGKFWIWMISQ